VELDPLGYVLVSVGGTALAVGVGQVREVLRTPRLELVPDREAPWGRGVALVDARGRSVPVVDLHTGAEASRVGARRRGTDDGDVLLPLYRHHVGLVVDRVLAVLAARDVVAESDEVPAALPAYARAVLRHVDGGEPVLLVSLPDAGELATDVLRDPAQRLGSDVLAGAQLPG
jgi:chemotaxis signal transduction protein